MRRLVLALVASASFLLVTLAVRAESRASEAPAPACSHERAQAAAILQRASSPAPLDQIMVDLMSVRLQALDNAEAALRAMPAEIDDAAHTERLVHVDTACALLQARLEDYRSLR